MDSSGHEYVSKEDLLKALLDLLVEPHLPIHIPPGAPSIHKQQSVAKQLHAVVLLYNYYHRKQCPQAEYLEFEPFCKLVVTLKPVLAWHMNCKPQPDSVESNDCQNQFSITEQAIQDACNVSLMLDASKDNPVIEGWEISKVSVLLLDSKKENCFLIFGSVNDGVWSVLEKDLEFPTSDSKLEERKHANKRRRIDTKSLTSEQKISDSTLENLAFLAVQDATGIQRTDLVVLEKHITYSLSKAKTTACFYIIQCSKLTSENVLTPLEYAITSLQGPLVEKCSDYWFTTPVVEYFHLLPYATILSPWHLRDIIPSSLQISMSKSTSNAENTLEIEDSGNAIVSSNMGDASMKMLDNYCNNMSCEINENCDNSTNCAKSGSIEVGNDIESSKKGYTSIMMKDCSDNQCNNMVCEINAISSGKGVGTSDSSQMIDKEKTLDESLFISNFVTKKTSKLSQEVQEAFKDKNIDGDSEPISECADFKVEEAKDTKDTLKEVATFNNSLESCHVTSFIENALNNVSMESADLENIINGQTESAIDVGTELAGEIILSASKGISSLQTVLGVLYKKNKTLCNKKRHIEDKIALYEKCIREILDVGEDDSTLEVKMIDEFCDEMRFKGTCIQEVQYQRMDSRANAGVAHSLRRASQELDAMCSANNWRLPTYMVYSTHGGLCVKVVVRGVSFECTCEGDLHSNSLEAKELAAAKMISKLCTMADVIIESFH